MTEKYTCVRCSEEYERYEVFVRDDFNEISAHVEAQEKWDLHQGGNNGLCKPCRMAVADYGAYLTEQERKELEPKEELE